MATPERAACAGASGLGSRPGSAVGPALGDVTVLLMLRALDTSPRGLTEVEAENRLAGFGPNTLPAAHGVSW